jgi:hypothetical protein
MSFPIPNPPMPQRVIQVIVVAGLTIIFLGFLWIVLTLPVSSMIATGIAKGWFATDMQLTVTFIQILIEALPILIGLCVMAWGWVRTVEERETGISTV